MKNSKFLIAKHITQYILIFLFTNVSYAFYPQSSFTLDKLSPESMLSKIIDINKANKKEIIIFLQELSSLKTSKRKKIEILAEKIISQRSLSNFSNVNDLIKRVKELKNCTHELATLTTLSLEEKALDTQDYLPVKIFNQMKKNIDIIKIEKMIYGNNISVSDLSIKTLSMRYGLLATEDEITHIFSSLDINAGDTILEIGPGQTITSIIAATMGADVTVIELSKEYLKRFEILVRWFQNDIKQAGGNLRIIKGDINNPEIKKELKDSSFDHVICLDVINEMKGMHNQSANTEFGVRVFDEQCQIVDTMLRVVKKDNGTIYFKNVNAPTQEFTYLTDQIQKFNHSKTMTFSPFYTKLSMGVSKPSAYVFKIYFPLETIPTSHQPYFIAA